MITDVNYTERVWIIAIISCSVVLWAIEIPAALCVLRQVTSIHLSLLIMWASYIMMQTQDVTVSSLSFFPCLSTFLRCIMIPVFFPLTALWYLGSVDYICFSSDTRQVKPNWYVYLYLPVQIIYQYIHVLSLEHCLSIWIEILQCIIKL